MRVVASMATVVAVVVFVLYSFDSTSVQAKMCTNMIEDPLQSHTLRSEVLTSDSANNATWRKEKLSSTSYNSVVELPKKRRSRRKTLEGVGGFLREVSLHEVRLQEGSSHWRAQRTNLDYLLWLDEERLVYSFKNIAGVSVTLGTSPYGGWEAPTSELRGHFVGNYLSATAHMWASTHNETLKRKMDYVVGALKECQDKIGSGYLSAFPSELFDKFEALERVWAPYYTIHKIMAGLLDQYSLGGNQEALEMVKWMAQYFYSRVQKVIKELTVEQHYLSLNEEVGGMNDVLYRLFTITRNPKHFVLAHLFDKPCFLGILAVKADHISILHANTHIPLVVGAQMRYEVSGDELYKEIATFFMDVVNTSHSYATGGTSVEEFWNDPKRIGSQLGTETEESCTTYNMLKVSRNLFRWSREMKHADYYERALTNGVLSIQRGEEPGIMIYMLPLGHGVSKANTFHGWGTKNDSFWCCYATGIESFSKLGDSIYFEGGEDESPELYVIQFIASTLNWKTGKLSITQQVNNVDSLDQYLRVSLTISTREGSGKSTLKLRIPSWTSSNGASGSLNGEMLQLTEPGNFLSISRKWNERDQIALQLPLILSLEAIKDDRMTFASFFAILYGPYLLAGLSTGDHVIKIGESSSLSNWISPVQANESSQLISLSQGSMFLSSKNQTLITMEPAPASPSGTDFAVHATFRMLPVDGHVSVVTLEPLDLPGKAVGPKKNSSSSSLAVVSTDGARFRIIQGLDGKQGSVSLRLLLQGGPEDCFLRTRPGSASGVGVSCGAREETGFITEVSFKMSKGLRDYNAISFVATGADRSFLLEPLMSLKDESYNVYFSLV